MILADNQITNHLIEPCIKENIQPASVDVRIAEAILVPVVNKTYSLDDDIHYTKVSLDNWEIKPGDFILGSTMEKVTLPDNIAAEITGKSTIGRVGLTVHATAGWIDPGFQGNVTFEIKNISNNTIKLKKGDLIAQVVFHQLATTATQSYNGKYQNAKGVEGSKVKKKAFKPTLDSPVVENTAEANDGGFDRDVGSDCDGDGICPVR